MKPIQKITAVLTASLLLATAANADRGPDRGYDRGSRYGAPGYVNMSYPRHHNNWVVPLVIGGVLGYVLSEPRRETVTYVSGTPTVYAPQPAQPVYEEQWVYFSDCDCQRKVLVPVR